MNLFICVTPNAILHFFLIYDNLIKKRGVFGLQWLASIYALTI